VKIPIDVAAVLLYIINPENLPMVWEIIIYCCFGMVKQAYQYASCKTKSKTAYYDNGINFVLNKAAEC
jgi:hypothetical protein